MRRPIALWRLILIPIGVGAVTVSCAHSQGVEDTVIASPAGVPRPPFDFAEADAELLEEVQHGAFLFFWNDVHPETGMVRDRSSAEIVSVAGVGFQLSALPIGVEHGWVTRGEATERAELILRSLLAAPDNRHAGVFFHYLDGKTAQPSRSGYETLASTIDSALLFAGVITASSYFGGEVAEMGDRLLRDADWTAFFEPEPAAEWARGFVSLGWRPDDPAQTAGPGVVLPFSWLDAGDEQRLVTFLAVCAEEGKNLPPQKYYELRRKLGAYADLGEIVWFPWSGALFTSFFSHCWIDYAHMGADDPTAVGVDRRSRVDWWENSRRLATMHRLKAIENPRGFATIGPDAWGIGASDGPDGYQVAHLHPSPIPMPGAIEGVDYPPENSADDWIDGTVAPYAAGSAIMFTPEASLAALRHYRGLRDAQGDPVVWREPDAASGQFGFLDSFNLDRDWTASDYVAIDQGPLLLAIENARTGLVWRLFHEHPVVERGMSRLRLRRK